VAFVFLIIANCSIKEQKRIPSLYLALSHSFAQFSKSKEQNISLSLFSPKSIQGICSSHSQYVKEQREKDCLFALFQSTKNTV